MIEDDFFGAFSLECGSLGTLKPLTLAQMVEMRQAIYDDLSNMASAGLSGDELAKARAGTAAHIAGMGLVQQSLAVLASPFLLVKAAAYMLGKPDWVKATMFAASKISPEHIPTIKLAVLQSYGVRLADPGEEKTAENPPMAATSPNSSET
jgi:hypothetical protein